MRILVIDDQAAVGRSLKRFFAGEAEIDLDTDPREALARLAVDARYDLLLCDMEMGTMTGVEFEAALRAAHPELVDRLVFISGGPVGEAASAFLFAPGRRWVEKPFDPPRLREMITRFRPGGPGSGSSSGGPAGA